MAVAWFICPYKRRVGAYRPTRYCSMDDYTPQIEADGGTWSESEVLGGYAVVKVRASQSTLDTIAAATDFQRIPLRLLDDPLSSLTNAQRTAIRNKLLAMGYTDAEITAAIPNIRNATLGQVLRFAASRRLLPRYDSVQDQIVLDGAYQPCRPVAEVDAVVTEV